MNTVKTLIVMLALLSAGALAQTYYKWTDEQGTTHFTSEPPRDQAFEAVNASAQVASGSSSPEPPVEPVREEQGQAAEAAVMPRPGAPDPRQVAARCEQSRANLFELQARRRIIVEREDGSQEYIDNVEQQRMIEDARAYLDQWCD
ncbi:MAG: DUF4124 domain-containing protein [Wenzhouxiangellaceae bacterium]